MESDQKLIKSLKTELNFLRSEAKAFEMKSDEKDDLIQEKEENLEEIFKKYQFMKLKLESSLRDFHNLDETTKAKIEHMEKEILESKVSNSKANEVISLKPEVVCTKNPIVT